MPAPVRSGRLRQLSHKLKGFLRRKPLSSPEQWTKEFISDDGDWYIDQLERDIAAARESIFLEVYILSPDDIGTRVIAALSSAVKRGVRVYLAVDGIGSAEWVSQSAAAASRAGIAVRVYHPPPWVVARFSVSTRQRLASAGFWLRYINRRNHRKVCVIDKRVAYVGSMNLTRVHMRSLMGDAYWRDVVARVEGPAIAVLITAFIAAWRKGWRVKGNQLYPSFSLRRPHVHLDMQHVVRLNHGMWQRRRYYRDLLQRIRSANNRVWIANAYFVPQNSLMLALGDAVKNGAEVHLLLSQHSDVWFMPYVSATFLARLQRAGVHVHVYLPGILHMKTMLIDDWASVGSTNLNNRSLRHDLEADVVLTRDETRRTLERIFSDGFAQAHDVTAKPVHLPWWVHWYGAFFLLLRRWL
jgi:cardiolipin synthase A/B